MEGALIEVSLYYVDWWQIKIKGTVLIILLLSFPTSQKVQISLMLPPTLWVNSSNFNSTITMYIISRIMKKYDEMKRKHKLKTKQKLREP